MATFPSIQPSFGFTKTKKPNVVVAKMGDGYEHRTTLGLPTNSDPMSLSVIFENISETDSDTIETFLTARVADNEAFDFTPPGESASKRFKYEGHTKTIEYANLATISLRMIEVFEP